jgi:hypothetical protein
MGVFGRYIMYRIDSLIMLGVLAVQLSLFTDLEAFELPPREWLPALIGRGASVYWTTLLGATLYWTIVDYHPALTGLRKTRIVSRISGEPLGYADRILRSFLKAFTLFGAEFLLLFALFNDDRRFLHDHVTKSERVAV